jgi:hypothetical protein
MGLHPRPLHFEMRCFAAGEGRFRIQNPLWKNLHTGLFLALIFDQGSVTTALLSKIYTSCQMVIQMHKDVFLILISHENSFSLVGLTATATVPSHWSPWQILEVHLFRNEICNLQFGLVRVSQMYLGGCW